MEKTKILFISQEITPYLPENQMSHIGRYLPQGIQEKGREIRAFMPRFGLINERRNQLHEVIRLSGMNLIINDTDHPLIIKVASIQAARMQVYFIDNEDYFQRKHIFYDKQGHFFEDNDERAIFFSRGVLETVKKLRWSPDIVHCHGWFTGLVPIYIKKSLQDDPLFANSKVVYSIYNDEFPTTLDENFYKKLQIESITDEDVAVVKNPSFLNLTKLATQYSDAIIVGSETINTGVNEFIQTIDKPVLPFQSEEEYINAYSEFYDEIMAESFKIN